MGLWPTRDKQNQRRPRESGDPSSVKWIPAFAGMTCFSGEPQAARNLALPSKTFSAIHSDISVCEYGCSGGL
jgi:hypothetical protein